MRTKLVYVLTCAPEKHYIEQALMSVFSARHWNPEACIVLFVDDLTDKLLVGTRSEVLNYISEKIVVSFEDDSLSPMYRSRFIKTSLRQRIGGDFLFIDCDTITARRLDGVDELTCQMGAVPDSHLKVKDYGRLLMDAVKEKIRPFNIDLENEEYYFSSGVVFVKDTPSTRQLYALWHNLWLAGTKINLGIDQPSLAKANIAAGHLIERIDDKFNCVMYTQPDFAKGAFILHFTSYRNPSWLFTERVYEIVRKEGLPEWMKPFVLNPIDTYLPFRSTLFHSSLMEVIAFARQIGKNAQIYADLVDGSFSDMQSSNKWHNMARRLFQNKFFAIGGMLSVMPAWINLKIHPSNPPRANMCSE